MHQPSRVFEIAQNKRLVKNTKYIFADRDDAGEG